MENSSSMAVELQRRQSSAVSPNVLMTVFASTLFCSALMLFSVQPMFAKMALPTLGGTPAVWAVSMCFFQTALLAGYCYAHALNRYLDAPKAAFVHLTLLAFTSFALPIALPADAANPPEGDAYFWLLGILAMGVGLPFFAVSASAPLLQAWFSKTGHKDANDPYFLYGASNLGSLIALLAYPFVFEPIFGLRSQSTIWGFGFFALTLLIAACAAIMLRSQTENVLAQDQSRIETAKTTISWSDRATWLFLAAIPSGLMTAITTYITTDIASAPFIWVMPLAMYLLSFIVVFKDKLGFNYELFTLVLPLPILVHLFSPLSPEGTLAAVIGFTMATFIAHRELYLRRPSAQNLTEFYIWMSAGGVVGGVFAALIAPQIFSNVWEFRFLLLLSLMARPGVLTAMTSSRRLAYLGLAAFALLCAVIAIDFGSNADNRLMECIFFFALASAIIALIIQTRAWPEHRAILVLSMTLLAFGLQTDGRVIHKERSFFGAMRVMLSDDDQHRVMVHGNTMHGAERIVADPTGAAGIGSAGLYYYDGGPMQSGIPLVRSLKKEGKSLNMGVVGLGTGSLACSAQAGDTLRYYEIDPMVGRIASNPQLFSFLTRCFPATEIVYGDARIKLQHEPNHRFDYLLVDAFSSDAIPVHLMTREALSMYFDKLAPDGLLAIHISNRFLDLEQPLAATLATLHGYSALRVFALPKGNATDASASIVVFVTKNPALLDGVQKLWTSARALNSGQATPWSDDYSNILPALVRGLRG